MPTIRCSKCGKQIFIDTYACPYEGELACEHCGNLMEVYITSSSGSRVKTKYPLPYDDLRGVWHLLNEVERDCLEEAALALGDKAYTGAEFMSLRNLESLCRRCYLKVKGEEFTGAWGQILDVLATDKDFEPYADVLNYFRRVRNRVGHPDKISSKLDAESSYKMSLRLTGELLTLLTEQGESQI